MKNKIYKYGEDIIWSLPILFQYEPIWGAIVKTCEANGIKIPIVNGFGCPKTVWAGGRIPNITNEIEPMTLLKIFKYCKNTGIIPTFTFSRINLKKEDLKDRYANYLLDMGLEFGARFIVYSDMLKDYIKEKDPNAQVIASIIKAQDKFQGENAKNWSIENETNYYNKLLKEYDMVVVRTEYVKDVLLYNPSLIDDISKIEVLINHRCMRNCPKAKEHYLLSESSNIHNTNFKCIYNELSDPASAYKNCPALSEKEIKKLVELGVKHLKIQGRGNNFTNTAMTLMLYTLIFEIEGSNIKMHEVLMKERAELELDEFAEYLNNKNAQ